MVPTETAAQLLGVSVEAMRSWRKRGLGPAYVRLPGGTSRRGNYIPHKIYGTICYPLEDLEAFAAKLRVQEGRMPRPGPGAPAGVKQRPRGPRKPKPGATEPSGSPSPEPPP